MTDEGPGSYAEQRRLEDALLKRVFHSCRQDDGTWQAREGLDADCPRCNPPGAALPDIQPHLNSDGEPCDCGQTPPQPGLVHHFKPVKLIGPDDRDRLAAEDQGQYYCVGADTGVLVAREGRPVYATLAEWQSFAAAVPGAVYISTTGSKGARKLGPLFGSVPFVDTQGAPDVVGRVVALLSFLESAAKLVSERIEQLEQQMNGRVHERELLRRAAAMIDEDAGQPPTYEMRLDWLARYREVTS